MRGKSRTVRSRASDALIELRKALGMTQQQFAVEVLGTAVTTIGRYETTHPPTGKVLVKLGMIAHERQCQRPAEAFRDLYLEEISADLKLFASWSSPPAHDEPLLDPNPDWDTAWMRKRFGRHGAPGQE